jgi:hypothetical protein
VGLPVLSDLRGFGRAIKIILETLLSGVSVRRASMLLTVLAPVES